ncbi:otoancorin [Acipenser oxyrinchus oxyrinchus]|uniref:Otoancorin n=1 Tax=Acipenser oxyrinchus oxyrinchus TaxID=40147 RepID=A0AAD8FUS9_ACIOX|nr:otoancorin [Acipenser oxyrinchus oxyrinchus]
MVSAAAWLWILSVAAQQAWTTSLPMMPAMNFTLQGFPPAYLRTAERLVSRCFGNGKPSTAHPGFSVSSSTVQFVNMTRPLPVFLPPLPLLNGMIFMNKADENFFRSLEMLRNISGDVPHSLLCPLHSMAAPLAWSTLLGSGGAVDPARFRLLLWGAEPLIRLGLQLDSLSALPMAGFNAGQRETMMGVFNQHYDVLPPGDREKLLHWVKHCVAMEMFNCSMGQPMGNGGKSEKDPRVKCLPRLRWLKAHTMAVLGRFLSLVPPSELEDIQSDELCCFFNHSLSESMFGNMYDLNHSQGRSLLSKLMTGCLDPAHNEESIGRLGALACFYDNVGALSDNASRSLLPLLSDCRNPGIKQLQRQLAEKVLGSGPLTKQVMVTLGPAAPALSLAQLSSLSAADIQDSLASLARVSWRREQASALASKYLSKVQISSPDDLMKMGTLVKGVSSAVLGSLKGDQLLRASGLEETARNLSPLQRKALVNAIQRDVNASALLQSLAGSLVGCLALHTLQQASVDSVGVIQGKSWNRGQAAHLVKKLFSRGIQPSDIRMLGSALQGVTCELIDSIGDPSMLETAAILFENKAWLSQHQLACSAKKLWAALNRTRADYFGSMNNSELQDVPPVFLLHLTLPQLSSLPARVCPCLLEKLSAVNLSLLPRRSPLRPALREKAFACLVMPALFPCVSKAISPLHHWETKPSDWSAEVVMSLGPLLALFNSSCLRTVSNTVQLKDTLTDLLSSQPPPPLTPGPLDFDTYLNLSSIRETLFHLSTSHQRTRRAVSCPVSLTLQEILDLGDANVHWSPDQLSCMSNKTFVDGLSTLAAVNGFADQQLAALKGQAIQAWGPPSGYSAEQTLALGCLLPAFNSSELGLVEVSSVDTLSAVAPCSGWTQEKRAALLQRFLQQSLLTPSSLGAVQLAGLGGFLCGMSETQVSQINVEAYRLAAAMVGAVSCPPAIMGALKSKAVTSFGDVKNWTASELSEIGNVLAGASAAELKTLDPSAMPFISPSAIPLIPADRLAALSVTQLRALGPVNAAMVTGEQAAVLSQAQREALSDAVGVAVERAVVVVVKETGTAAPLKGGSDQLGILGVLVMVLPLLLLALSP